MSKFLKTFTTVATVVLIASAVTVTAALGSQTSSRSKTRSELAAKSNSQTPLIKECSVGNLKMVRVTEEAGFGVLGQELSFVTVSVINRGETCLFVVPKHVTVWTRTGHKQAVPASDERTSSYVFGRGARRDVVVGASWPVSAFPRSGARCVDPARNVVRVSFGDGRDELAFRLPTAWREVCSQPSRVEVHVTKGN